MMADMGMTMDMPWNAADVLFTFAMWAVMMVGMMTASAAPVLLLFAAMHRGRGGQRAPRVVFAFGAGYLLVWTAFSAGAALAQWGLHQAAMLSPAMTDVQRAAQRRHPDRRGVPHQSLHPVQGEALSNCRSRSDPRCPRRRVAGALRMGIETALPASVCLLGVAAQRLFVVGVMNWYGCGR